MEKELNCKVNTLLEAVVDERILYYHVRDRIIDMIDYDDLADEWLERNRKRVIDKILEHYDQTFYDLPF